MPEVMLARVSGTVGRRVGVVAAVVVLVAVASGCGVQVGARGGEVARHPGTQPTLSAAEVMDEVGPSLALVSTPTSTGSAVLIDDGYLVTNAHVVDPFSEVDVTFEGQDLIPDVKVVGVDLVADIAVLGPVEVANPPTRIAGTDPVVIEAGGRAFLVGFPGDQDPDDPEAKVTHGKVLGDESDERWDLAYVDTSTPIGDGQSGGALVDAHGEVIGISAMSNDDGDAMSLRGDHVDASVEAILHGDGSDWRPVSPHPDDTEADAYNGSGDDVHAYLVGVHDPGTVLEVTVDGGDPQVALSPMGWANSPTQISTSIDPADTHDYWFAEDLEHQVAPTKPGTWRFAIDDSYEPTLLTVGSPSAGALHVHANLPFQEVEVSGSKLHAEVGQPGRGILMSTEEWAYGEVTLREGATYEIVAHSPSGDVGWQLAAIGGAKDLAKAGDGGGGLFGLDAKGRFTPDHDGSYGIWINEYDGISTAVELDVTEV